jgi:hypothetical protein
MVHCFLYHDGNRDHLLHHKGDELTSRVVNSVRASLREHTLR